MFSCSKTENITLLVSANVFKKTPSMTDLQADCSYQTAEAFAEFKQHGKWLAHPCP